MNGKYYVSALLLAAAALLATIVAWPDLTAWVPTHWNLHGVADSYSPRWAVWLFPPAMAGIALLTRILPWLSPKHFEVDTFRSTYGFLMLLAVGLLAYVDGLILWIGVGHKIDVRPAISGAVCLLFVLLGNVLGKVRRNFFIGVRTPWALANERVWNATHRLAAKTFVLGGLAGLALMAFGTYRLQLAALISGALIPAVYSLVFYKRLQRRGEI